MVNSISTVTVTCISYSYSFPISSFQRAQTTGPLCHPSALSRRAFTKTSMLTSLSSSKKSSHIFTTFGSVSHLGIPHEPLPSESVTDFGCFFSSAHIGLLFSNMIVGLFYLFAGGDFGQTFGLGLLYFVLFTPVSFVCWFRPAYKAFRDDSSFNFMVFFFVFFFQFLMSCLNFIGIGDTGSWYVSVS